MNYWLEIEIDGWLKVVKIKAESLKSAERCARCELTKLISYTVTEGISEQKTSRRKG